MVVDGNSLTTPNPEPTDHLVVLIHGLWGKPSHLNYVVSALEDRDHNGRLHLLAVKQNSGYHTYDGIEVGGERAVYEIEQALKELSKNGCQIKKISVIGYSLGGLVARYAVGLLYARGWFDKLVPVNFTTFATPHVGVRSPLKGVANRFWNVLGPRTVSVSGQQLFLIDSFRDTGRPLLSVLADPESIFITGLARFNNRCIYGNIVNDRVTAFYTSIISKIDPFRNIEDIRINYVKGYEPVVVDPDVYISPREGEEGHKSWASRLYLRSKRDLSKFFLRVAIIIFLPFALSLFLTNSVLQTFRSQRRIRLHHDGKAGGLFTGYRVPLIVQDVRHVVEEVFEDVNQRQEPEYLSDASAEDPQAKQTPRPSRLPNTLSAGEKKKTLEREDAMPSLTDGTLRGSLSDGENQISAASSSDVESLLQCPILALTPEQFAIIDSLNAVGLRKYPVHIHNHRRSHAAIIVRSPKKEWEEGKVVVRHWLDNEFHI